MHYQAGQEGSEAVTPGTVATPLQVTALSPGVTGGLADALADRNDQRGALAAIEQSVKYRWKMTPEMAADLPRQLAELAQQAHAAGDTRSFARSANILRQMAADNVAAAVALDKINRLDSGDPTENHSMIVVNITQVPNREGTS